MNGDTRPAMTFAGTALKTLGVVFICWLVMALISNTQGAKDATEINRKAVQENTKLMKEIAKKLGVKEEIEESKP